MKIETKLIICSIISVSVGLASIMPLAFLMTPATAQTTQENPWFNLNLPYATCSVFIHNSYPTAEYTFSENFSVNPGIDHSQANGRIEYYQIQIYSDQEQIMNTTVFIAANCTYEVYFARSNWFNTTSLGSSGIFVDSFNGTLPIGQRGTLFRLCISADDEAIVQAGINSPVQQIQAIQNANIIYFDVHRVGYITCNDNSTVVTLADDELIQHLELTKNGDKFTSGIEPPYWPY
jgi:hypothetical protein